MSRLFFTIREFLRGATRSAERLLSQPFDDDAKREGLVLHLHSLEHLFLLLDRQLTGFQPLLLGLGSVQRTKLYRGHLLTFAFPCLLSSCSYRSANWSLSATLAFFAIAAFFFAWVKCMSESLKGTHAVKQGTFSLSFLNLSFSFFDNGLGPVPSGDGGREVVAMGLCGGLSIIACYLW